MGILGNTIFAFASVGAGFIAYCYYYDQQRLNDPDYKQKVHERREREREHRESTNSMKCVMDSLKDDYSIERYYRQESQLGKKLIARGEYEMGTEHLANGLFVCRQPAMLLEMLHASLPGTLYYMLIQKLQELTLRVNGERYNELKSAQSEQSMESAVSMVGSKISMVPFHGYNNSSVNFELE